MRMYWIICVFLLVSSTSGGAPLSSCGVTSAPIRFPANNRGVLIAISKDSDALLFRLRAGQMNLDLDGNEHTYGIRDQGIDGICNGLSALHPSNCAGVTPRGLCFAACQKAIQAWDGTPASAKTLFCSVGIGSGCGKTFVAPLQPAPNQDYFVSETATKYVRPSGGPANWVEMQAAQLDSLLVPYFVLPPALRKLPFDASPGDAGVMVRTDGMVPPVYFIIGDLGNNDDIGESSAQLHKLLSTSGRLPKKQETSAFGKMVTRVEMDNSPEVAVAIFRHSSERPGGVGSSINTTATTVVAWINNAGAQRLGKLGGPSNLIHCAPTE